MVKPVHVVGGGLAGSEAAWQLAPAGVPVVLHEMRPLRRTEAHQTDALAELVCSNSFRSDDWASNAVGLLHEEMRRAGSLIMAAADRHKLPAGGALAVDREGFAGRGDATRSMQPLVAHRRAKRSMPCLQPTGTASSWRQVPSPRRRSHGRPVADRRGRARLLRRHRADRPPRLDRHGHLLAAVALRQRGPRRRQRRLHQLPARRGAIPRLRRRRCSPARKPRSTSGRIRRPISKAACRSK